MKGDPCSVDEHVAEYERKLGVLAAFVREKGLSGVVVSRHENIAWLTAGLADTRVGVLRETGAASVLVTSEGEAVLLTTNNEVERFMEEDFAALKMRAVVKPWYANDLAASVREVVGARAVATDQAGGEWTVVSLQPLRLTLTQDEVKRYRWVGRAAATTAQEIVRALQPGMSEREMQSMLARELIAKGMLPSVYLEAVDDRARRYKHAVPRNGVLESLAMLGFCVRRWGLTVAMTRFVHFGKAPLDLEERFQATAVIAARLQHVTRDGISAEQLFQAAREAYAAVGYEGEEKGHHQGGATGYMEREWIARPGGAEKVRGPQAFAWNPSLNGAKSEDTVLLIGDAIEVLTSTPELPVVKTEIEGRVFESAGLLTM